MNIQRNTFNKSERLCSKTLISNLFTKKSHSFVLYPYKIVWRIIEESNSPAQVCITVSKKHFKKAVDRNKFKRKIKNIHRLNKNDLYNCLNSLNLKISMMVINLSSEHLEYSKLEKKYQLVIQNLIKKINNISGN